MPHDSPAIPDIPLDHKDKKFLDPMKETLEVMSGVRKSGDRKVNAVPTWQELINIGVITADQVPK